MKNYTCCCVGHRDVYENINEKLKTAVEEAIVSGCSLFITGGNGEFDLIFANTVKMLKTEGRDIKLVLKLPYFISDLNTNKEHYRNLYDEVIISERTQGVHYKRAISLLNRLMIEESELVIAYVRREFGGAYKALKYAEKLDKRIVNLAER